MVEADVSSGEVDPDMNMALETIMEELLNEVTLGLCFEIHRSCKIGSFFIDGGDDVSDTDYAIVERPGVDILGQIPSKKNFECVCPNCQRHLAASRFAPHLEKCMGMGRNSSRIASRRIANNQKQGSDESGQDDENDNDWNYAPDSKRLRKIKKEKMSNSPRNRRLAKLRTNNLRKLRNGSPNPGHQTVAAERGGAGTPTNNNIETTTTSSIAATIDPLLATTTTSLSGLIGSTTTSTTTTNLTHGIPMSGITEDGALLNYESMTLEERKALLLTKCGVISEITKKMCTRSMKCAQHSDEQRRLVRQLLLRQNVSSHEIEDMHIDIDTYDDAESQSLRESLQWEASSNSSNNSATTTSSITLKKTSSTSNKSTVGGKSGKGGKKSSKANAVSTKDMASVNSGVMGGMGNVSLFDFS